MSSDPSTKDLIAAARECAGLHLPKTKGLLNALADRLEEVLEEHHVLTPEPFDPEPEEPGFDPEAAFDILDKRVQVLEQHADRGSEAERELRERIDALERWVREGEPLEGGA